MAVGFGAVHPDAASKGGLICTAKLIVPGGFLKMMSFEKPVIFPFQLRDRPKTRS